jgi:hypothetical protein
MFINKQLTVQRLADDECEVQKNVRKTTISNINGYAVNPIFNEMKGK